MFYIAYLNNSYKYFFPQNGKNFTRKLKVFGIQRSAFA